MNEPNQDTAEETDVDDSMVDLLRKVARAPAVRGRSEVIVGSVVADRFRIESLAGQGGMGAVYRAVDSQSGELVALKVIQRGAVEEGATERFLREARLLSEVHHAGIVRYFAHGEISEGSPNLATYAATKSFTTILAEGLWSELKPRGVEVLACVAGAILTPGYQQAESAKPAPGTLTAEVVAETALNALGKGRGPIVVPGAVNKLGRFVLTRLLSRRAAIALMSRNTGGLS